MKYTLSKKQNKGCLDTKILRNGLKIGFITISLSLLVNSGLNNIKNNEIVKSEKIPTNYSMILENISVEEAKIIEKNLIIPINSIDEIMNISDIKKEANENKATENIVLVSEPVGEIKKEEVKLEDNNETINKSNNEELVIKNASTEIKTVDKTLKIYTDFNISDELSQKIEMTIKKYPRKNGFYVETADGDLKFGYNENVVIFGASSVKSPYALYCYNEIENGNGSLEETKKYEARFTHGGTGNMKNTATVGKNYTLKYLLYESIYSSDNIAYLMLQDRFGRDGYNKMLDQIGCETSKLSPYRNWIDTTPKELVTIWREIYNYTRNNNGEFYYSLDTARNNILDECVTSNTIHKGGWTDNAYNESGIIYGENPYIITIMTNSGGNSIDQKYVRDIIKLSDEIVKEYSLSYSKSNIIDKMNN